MYMFYGTWWIPCKHQVVVAIKYHSESFNYIAALTLEDSFGHNNEINHQNVNLLNRDELNTEVIVESSQNRNYKDDINNHITLVENFFNRILNDIKNNQ
ncbi:1005_t:CDS:2 [Gigaspora margarita]|uniref:1005_t:CDS:1 n=1 Tax=Gigaspora margarita TaxID=4874 RepID=A0ABN7VSM6_GIGMA|nr:1005_t:CDS:2 [Gigaspora margarita]